VIEVKELTKTYGGGPTAVHALKGVSFDIEAGEFVVLLGPSGSGKTTLLNQIGAIETPTSGSVRVSGTDLSSLDPDAQSAFRLRSCGFVFQFFNLVPTLTARENVELIAELTTPEPGQRAVEVLTQVGLGDRLDRFPSQLSGGEQQRVSIARGLVKDPPLMLCDEPTGSLDLETGRHVLDLLQSAASSGDRTVVLVTHNSAIAEMADRVLRLRDGEIVEDERVRAPVAARDLVW
jgi:putative ABC transport system ATP-binding protein